MGPLSACLRRPGVHSATLSTVGALLIRPGCCHSRRYRVYSCSTFHVLVVKGHRLGRACYRTAPLLFALSDNFLPILPRDPLDTEIVEEVFHVEVHSLHHL